MKKIRFFSLVLSLLLMLNLSVTPVAAAAADDETTTPTEQESVPEIPAGATMDNPGNTVTFGCHSVDARYPINGSDEILTYSDSAILYEVTSDTLVYTYNPDEVMHPSSFVKVMTALLALEHGDLEEMVLCREEALVHVVSGALVANFVDGERVSLEDLLYSMLVGSCNDAALVIADHISGSQENFVNLMNRRAAELGCTETVFKNSTGLHHDEQFITARDMVRILREALKHPEFVEIFGTPNYRMEATNMSESRYFVTTNYMISDEVYLYYKDSRVTGGRTGTLDNKDRCLAVTASVGGGTYIAVTMGTEIYYGADGSRPYSHGSFVDTDILLNLASKSSLVRVTDPEQIVDQLPVQGGDHHVSVGANEVVACVLPPEYSWNMITTRTEMVNGTLTAPVKAGTKVANVQYWYGSVCIGETSLYTKIDVPLSTRVTSDSGTVDDGGFDAGAITTALLVLGIIFAVILVLFGGLFLVRTVRIAMRNARSKKRRQERRRSK